MQNRLPQALLLPIISWRHISLWCAVLWCAVLWCAALAACDGGSAREDAAEPDASQETDPDAGVASGILGENSLGNSLFNPDVGGAEEEWAPGEYIVPTSVEDVFVRDDGGLLTATSGVEPIHSLNARFDASWQRDGFYLPPRDKVNPLIAQTVSVVGAGNRVFLGQERRVDWQSGELFAEGGVYVMGASATDVLQVLHEGEDVTALAATDSELFVAVTDGTSARVDVHSLSNLDEISQTFSLPARVRKLKVEGELVVALHDPDPEHLPKSDYESPYVAMYARDGRSVVARLATSGRPGGICLRGDSLFVGRAPLERPEFGIEVFDIAQPNAPVATGLLGREAGPLDDSDGPTGTLGEDRNGRIIDLECLTDGFVAVIRNRPLWMEPTTAILELDSSAKLRRQLMGLSFVDSAVRAGTDEATYYSGEYLYEVDWTSSGESFHRLVGTTLDPFRYPDDLRLQYTPQTYHCPAAVFFKGDQSFVAIGFQGQSEGQYFSVESNAHVLRPVAAWHYVNEQNGLDFDWPRSSSAPWNVWTDRNRDGQMDAPELVLLDANANRDGTPVPEPQRLGTIAVDGAGSLWMTSFAEERNRLAVVDPRIDGGQLRVPNELSGDYELPIDRFDPGLFNPDSLIIEYDPDRDDLYVLGWTSAHPFEPRSDAPDDAPSFGASKGLVRYANFRSSYPNLDPRWETEVPHRSPDVHGRELALNSAFSGAAIEQDIDVAGAYVFVTYSYGRMLVYGRDDGAMVSSILPLNHQHAKVDCRNAAVHVEHESASGEYRIMQESLYTSSVNAIRWRPRE